MFHEKLGTVADKVDRVAKLARWLVEEGIISPSPRLRGEGRGEGPDGAAPADPASPSPDLASLGHPSQVDRAPRDLGDAGGITDLRRPASGEREKLADQAERAARLAKADLVTGMVGEFPELQGLMGRYYATAQGEPPEIAHALEMHYKPVGPSDRVPTEPVSIAVALADKLNVLSGFWSIDEKPTGSRDPFALRRAALGVIRIITENGLKFPLKLDADLLAFFHDRLKVSLREAGARHDQLPEARVVDFVDAGLGHVGLPVYRMPARRPPASMMTLMMMRPVMMRRMPAPTP